MPGRPDVGGSPYRLSGDHRGRDARQGHRSVLVKTTVRVPCSPSLSQCREVWAEWSIAREDRMSKVEVRDRSSCDDTHWLMSYRELEQTPEAIQ
jgi:hypothetical protein